MFKKPFMLDRGKTSASKLPSMKIRELCAGEGYETEEKRLQSISVDVNTRSMVQKGRTVVEVLS